MKHAMVAWRLIVLTAILSLPVNAGAGQHQSYTDEQIATIINHDLRAKGIETVDVEVKDGVVTLRGRVKSAWQMDTAYEIARDTHDVKDVRTELVVERGESDESLDYRLRAAIDNNVFYGMFDAVSGTVENGVATLTGWVTNPYKSAELVESASRVPGVTEVRNEIKVLPVSFYDDGLRRRLASAIYSELPELASQKPALIHIIVDNGRVTLVGVVRTRLERVRAEQAARSMLDALSVENELLVESPGD
jgi:hyperosmotically inducible protein